MYYVDLTCITEEREPWQVVATDHDYDGVRYEDMVFDLVDWSKVGDHDPGQRSQRKGTDEQNVLTSWADEAVRDERRWARSARSHTGLTV